MAILFSNEIAFFAEKISFDKKLLMVDFEWKYTLLEIYIILCLSLAFDVYINSYLYCIHSLIVYEAASYAKDRAKKQKKHQKQINKYIYKNKK